ncbi:transglycosylase-like protein with SLT domain [Chitinophaga skermanii]|uniref:Transglycosylase-like protein with SLT domain n=1 Tax=Chitinophaga skermanii TaxID=331697 RepID=A0A327PZH3_9BACT|nr:lytic transglycosylase domain-containing protein [Chitinophaga skermanii]RAI97024.1 transglycosylase-like protein with SLT domain [Chitinophaga skermanii]
MIGKSFLLLSLLIYFFAAKGQNIEEITFCGSSVPIERKAVRNRLKSAISAKIVELNDSTFLQRVQFYLPYFSIVLKNYGLPDDLKFIAVVESRLLRGANSVVGAGGVWQIMPATGLGEKLLPTERHKIIASTHAACRLLRKLYNQLKDWPLVCAAYNYGIGRLYRAMKKQNSFNYYSLQLNQETANYVYNIIAFKVIIESLENAENQPPQRKDGPKEIEVKSSNDLIFVKPHHDTLIHKIP